MKKLLSILLSMFMIVTTFTTNVFADGNVAMIGDHEYETLADAIAAVPTDGNETTIILIDDIGSSDAYKEYDIAYANKIESGKNVVFDLNGHKVYAKTTVSGESCFLRVENGGSLKIKSSIDGGEIKYLDGLDNTGGFVVCSAGNLVFEGGLLENVTECINSAIQGAIDVHANEWGTPYTNNTSFTMSGGVLKSHNDNTLRLYDSSQTGSSKVNISAEITGGEIYGKDAVFIMPQWTKGYDVSHSEIYTNPISLNISGGIFNTDNGIRIAGNVGEKNIGDKTINIIVSGGEWKFTDRAKYRVNNVALHNSGNWTSTKASTENLNSLVDVKWKVDIFDGSSLLATYNSLQEAINNVDNGNIVKLRTDMILNECLISDTGKSFTIDLNGKNIEMTNEPFEFAAKVENQFGGAAIIIKDKVLITDSSDNPGKINLNKSSARAYVFDGGDVTVEKVTVSGNYAAFYVIGDISYAQNSGIKPSTLTLNSGLLKGDTCGVGVQGKNTRFVINDGLVTISDTGYYAIAGNGSHDVGGTNRWNTIIDINGGIVDGNKAIGIYHPQGGDSVINISGGKVIGTTAIAVKGGKINITNDAEVEGTQDFADPQSAVFSGTNDTGNAIYVEGSYESHDPAINVKGGLFNAGTGAKDFLIKFNDNNASIKASAGYYDSDVQPEYIADGYECIALDSNDQAYIDKGYTHKIGVRTSKGTAFNIDTDNDIPTSFNNVNSLNDAIDNIIEANQEKFNNNETINKSTITVSNGTDPDNGIKAEIDDKVIIVADTNSGNEVKADPGYKMNNPVEEGNRTTYTATALDIGYAKDDAAGSPTGSGIKDSKKTDTVLETPCQEVTQGVKTSAESVNDTNANKQLETIVSEGLKNILSNRGINQGIAARTLNNNGITVTNEGTGEGVTAAKNVNVFVLTYYETEVKEDKTAETNKSYKLDITPMYQAYASTASSKDVMKTEGTDKDSVKIGDSALVDCTGKTITLKVQLPDDFITNTNQKVYVIHHSVNGIKTYNTTVTKESDKFYIEFTNPDGFSAFEITLEKPETPSSPDSTVRRIVPNTVTK